MTYSDLYQNIERAITQMESSQQKAGELQVFVNDAQTKLYQLRAQAEAAMHSDDESTKSRLQYLRSEIVSTNEELQRYQQMLAQEQAKMQKSVQYLVVSRSELNKVVSQLEAKMAGFEDAMEKLDLAEGQFAHIARAQRDKLDVSYQQCTQSKEQATALIERINEALGSASGTDEPQKVLRRW